MKNDSQIQLLTNQPDSVAPISDYSYPMEHCTALGEPNILPSVIKFDHLVNN